MLLRGQAGKNAPAASLVCRTQGSCPERRSGSPFKYPSPMPCWTSAHNPANVRSLPAGSRFHRAGENRPAIGRKEWRVPVREPPRAFLAKPPQLFACRCVHGSSLEGAGRDRAPCRYRLCKCLSRTRSS